MNRARTILASLATLSLVACSRGMSSSGPLPGDAVDPDGGVTLTPAPLAAPGVPRASDRPREPIGAIEARLFAPDLVMDHQGSVALRPEQRDAIQRELERGQRDMSRLQWELAREKEKLVAVLDGAKVDEAEAIRASAELMKREDAIKAAHLTMLVRVKNVLTAEQQATLRALRDGPDCGAKDATPAP